MDEVGARVHLKNINVPQNILDLEQKIEDIKVEKNKVVKSQLFEKAAALRDSEKKLQEELEAAKVNWEDEVKSKRYPITEEHIADVIHMMTGIPVNRMVAAGKVPNCAIWEPICKVWSLDKVPLLRS